MNRSGLAVVLSAVAAAVCHGQEAKPAPAKGEEILVLCGGSMRAGLEQLKAAYEKESADRILTTYGDSGEVCAQIQKTGKGDLFVAHDPFMPWAAARGLISEWTTLAYLKVVIVVPKGNPKGIQGLEDLARPGLRVGLGDQTYSTSGQIMKHVLAAKPYGPAVFKNVIMESKGHQQRCNDIIFGALDAATVWDAIASNNVAKLDAVPVDMTGIDAITSATYKQSDVRQTRVTVGMIAGAEKRPAVQRFYRFLKEKGPQVLGRFGFTPAAEAPAAAAK